MNGVKPYNAHMFTVDKHLANGEFDKTKSRIVLNGNEQEAELFPDRSSPTVAVHSIMASLAVAAYNGVKEVAKIDVKGAFIQTPMEGPPVFIKFNKQLTKFVVKVLPDLAKYVKDGILYSRVI